eukprot:CAMPEP_0196781048 /NCGR_PEP_ID=MMETSP1104-20130614/9023_1 /TAXON_ID=33652 /ORGANISM="Cafeteria sp., Strain Caron Lab Isolate" /LENGTH=188 /DNA_ID=CAMNT_0042151265 /DNA_START=6 /DNA_END=568 /DNA_ORIENTATION=-
MEQPHAVQTLFGSSSFSEDELRRIQRFLSRKLPSTAISERSAPGGGRVAYIEGHRVIQHANEVLGFDGWGSSIMKLTVDYVDESNGRWSVCVSAIVRIMLKDGTFHEDVGCGLSDNMRHKGQALEKAQKEAVTDATKRALRYFGNYLGNSVYDREHTRTAKRGGVASAASAEEFVAAHSPIPPALEGG